MDYRPQGFKPYKLRRPITPQRARRIARQFDAETDRKARQAECSTGNIAVDNRQVRRAYARVMVAR